jgi:hypothetical protein
MTMVIYVLTSPVRFQQAIAALVLGGSVALATTIAT